MTLEYANRQLRYWMRVVERLQASDASDASDTEKEQEGKRDIPPTPPIERKGEEEKEHTHTSRARASVAEVAEECRRIGSDIDPQYFVDFYDAAKGGWPKDWKAKLRNWTANTIESGRVKTPPEERHVESQKELCDRLMREVLEERAKRQKSWGQGPANLTHSPFHLFR